LPTGIFPYGASPVLIGRIGCPASLAFLLLLTSSSIAPAQVVVPGSNVQIAPRDRVPLPRTGTGSIKGRIVDGTSGGAVPRARVTLMGSTRATVLTDASGAFAFSNLPPGPLNLSIDKSTYLSSRYPTSGRTVRSNMRPLVLADGQALEGVTIPLFHGGAISGRVVDASGDPVDYAQVSVLRVPAPGRVGRPAMRSGSSTDDRGEFRVGRLEPGTYIVQVSARRGPGQMDETAPPGSPTSAPLPQPLPTYYPGALSIDQAQPITIERGQAATDIDIVLAEGIPGVITGTVTTSNGASPSEMNGFVNVRRVVSEVSRGFDGYSTGTGIRPDGTFRLVLAPGEYQIEARISPRVMNGAPRPEDEQFGSAKVNVASGAEDAVAIAVGRGATATGRVMFEGTTAPPPSPGKTRVPLFSENGECRSGEATIAADWTFKIEGLNGTCSPPPTAAFGRWMLKAVMINGENAADAPITFQPDQQIRNVQVIVTDKRSEMVFQVSDESGQPTREYVVVAYPIQKSKWPSGARIFVPPPGDQVLAAAMGRPTSPTAATPGPTPINASPRREAMQALRPGEYYVVAVDDMEQEDWRDPVVLDRLRSSAVRVNVPEGATADVPLRRINFADAISTR
jgi:hypothetical protein